MRYHKYACPKRNRWTEVIKSRICYKRMNLAAMWMGMGILLLLLLLSTIILKTAKNQNGGGESEKKFIILVLHFLFRCQINSL